MFSVQNKILFGLFILLFASCSLRPSTTSGLYVDLVKLEKKQIRSCKHLKQIKVYLCFRLFNKEYNRYKIPEAEWESRELRHEFDQVNREDFLHLIENIKFLCEKYPKICKEDKNKIDEFREFLLK